MRVFLYAYASLQYDMYRVFDIIILSYSSGGFTGRVGDRWTTTLGPFKNMKEIGKNKWDIYVNCKYMQNMFAPLPLWFLMNCLSYTKE